MTKDLIAAAVARFDFRPRGPFETPDQYLEALIDYAASRDNSAAHELRTGRRQADWTPEDLDTFVAAQMAAPSPPSEFQAGRVVSLRMVESHDLHEVSIRNLLRLADAGLHTAMALCRQRTASVDAIVQIMATVLLTSGRVVIAPVAERGDRVAVLRLLAQNLPVFGYFLVFDGILHDVNRLTQTSTKQETLIAQIGTRDLRVMKRRPYDVVEGRPVFRDPPPEDIVQQLGEWVITEDPYAAIFDQPATTTERRH